MSVVGNCRNLHFNLCPCFVCSEKFSLDNGVEDLLIHLCFTHHIIVENIERIADLQEYMRFYAERLQRAPLESFAKVLNTNEFIDVEMTNGDTEPREQKYYFLGEFFREDEKLRKDMHAKQLKVVIRQQIIDLGPHYFLRHCFYCDRSLETTNAQFINHLKSHSFHLGDPDKLVYISKFIEAIEDTFRNLRCLYCETEFHSRRDLILHMENRGHAKIHPKNSFYDQFYIINYAQYGKTWLDFSKRKNKSSPEADDVIVSEVEDDPDWSNGGTDFAKRKNKSSPEADDVIVSEVEDDPDWSNGGTDFAKRKNKSSPEADDVILSEVEDDPDWSNGGTEPENIKCIFCKHICRSWDGTLLHMQAFHNFNFKISFQPLKFYDQIKIVNYIRRRTLSKLCVNCDFHSENEIEVLTHMEKADHLTIPDRDLWDHDENFLSVLENDMFLCHLEESDEDFEIPKILDAEHERFIAEPDDVEVCYSPFYDEFPPIGGADSIVISEDRARLLRLKEIVKETDRFLEKLSFLKKSLQLVRSPRNAELKFVSSWTNY